MAKAKKAVVKKLGDDSYVPQQEITYKSDGNVIVFQNTIDSGAETMYLYKYKTSITKKGHLLGLTKSELERLLKNNI